MLSAGLFLLRCAALVPRRGCRGGQPAGDVHGLQSPLGPVQHVAYVQLESGEEELKSHFFWVEKLNQFLSLVLFDFLLRISQIKNGVGKKFNFLEQAITIFFVYPWKQWRSHHI